MYDILMFLAHLLPLYRVAQDAGMGMFQFENVEARENYMESWLITKGLL
jgi:hypothetical protein